MTEDDIIKQIAREIGTRDQRNKFKVSLFYCLMYCKRSRARCLLEACEQELSEPQRLAMNKIKDIIDQEVS